ncbi:hypothetical protein L211DRAFT_510049 [Terfezia boudieri ATCC MYA-4762]|uniref:Uncharacterized protein n=1 Tax=Terfezia boudieri ATCC MYA-4762 TaxID=1051890 RepID=A0A3N4LGP0_9PEZI|nr:hypothetical protein L211DRAFT_510049 [Terfezia boudieri ATCC MYA-4762]
MRKLHRNLGSDSFNCTIHTHTGARYLYIFVLRYLLIHWGLYSVLPSLFPSYIGRRPVKLKRSPSARDIQGLGL